MTRAAKPVPDKEVLVETDYESPVGTLRLVASTQGLRAILWPNDSEKRGRVKLASCKPGTSPILAQTVVELDQYFAGEREEFEIPLDPVGTEFQLEVWHALAQVPYGQTTSYGRQAQALGRPKSVRAVASANGKNPLSIVLPCHRILGADGSLTGFAGGLEGKAWLLAHEGQRLNL